MLIATPSINYRLNHPGCSGIACRPCVSIRKRRDIEHELLTGKIGALCVRGLPTFDGYDLSPDIEVLLDQIHGVHAVHAVTGFPDC